MKRALTMVAVVVSMCACGEPQVTLDGGGLRDGGSPRPDPSVSSDAAPIDGGALDAAITTPDDAGAGALVELRDGVLDVMPLGDSITLGVNGGYRNTLFTALTADGYDVDFVGSESDVYTRVADHDHEGHPGFTTGNLRDGLDAWLDAASPDVVLLMAGTNDLAWWIAESTDDVLARLEGIVDRILERLPTCVVIVGTIPPLSPMRVDPSDRERADLVVAYDASIHLRFAGRERVRVADVNAALVVADLYDGVHPTEDAHAGIAAVWYDALRPLLPAP